jgi:hypothetical protein
MSNACIDQNGGGGSDGTTGLGDIAAGGGFSGFPGRSGGGLGGVDPAKKAEDAYNAYCRSMGCGDDCTRIVCEVYDRRDGGPPIVHCQTERCL